MIDPASMGDWAQATVLGVSFAGLALAGVLTFRKLHDAELREDLGAELLAIEAGADEYRTGRARMARTGSRGA
jgi:hypothetical protein